MAKSSALCSPSNRSATAGTQASQGTTAQAFSNSPFWRNQPWVSELSQLLEAASSERHALAFTARVMGPAYVAALRKPFVLKERVLNTMAEARALSTIRLYTLKWSVFSTWCQDHDLDQVTSEVSVVLSFLQELLDKQHSSSTIKVYVSAIAAFHGPFTGRPVRRGAVIQFL